MRASQNGPMSHKCPHCASKMSVLVHSGSVVNVAYTRTWTNFQRLAPSGFCPEALILHLARQQHVGSVSSYSHCDCSFNENVGVQIFWRRSAEESIFFSFTHSLLPQLWEPEPTQAWRRVRNQWRKARADSLIQRIISVAGCHLTFSISLYKNRQVLSDSSCGNKTRNYSYPVWRRKKKG